MLYCWKVFLVGFVFMNIEASPAEKLVLLVEFVVQKLSVGNITLRLLMSYIYIYMTLVA